MFSQLLSHPATLTILVLDLALIAWILYVTIRQIIGARKRAQGSISELESFAQAAKTDRARGKQLAISSKYDDAKTSWIEYDKTLTQSQDAVKTMSTSDAETFFNTKTISPELFSNRILEARPSILTAIGVLGTFLGLTIGLWGLNTSGDVQELQSGVNLLIGSAGLAFITSVAGVGTSLLAAWILKHTQQTVARNITKLEAHIDDQFERYSTESALQTISRNTKDSSAALEELHEKIGMKFQTAVNGLADNMQAALMAAIDNALAPAVTQITSESSKNSTELFNTLNSRFVPALEDVSRKQAQSMETASTELTGSIAALSSQMSQSLAHMEEAAASARTENSELLASQRAAAQTQAEEDRAATAALILEMRNAAQQQFAAQQDSAAAQTKDMQEQLGALSALASEQQETNSRAVEQLAHLSEQTVSAMRTTSERLDTSATSLTTVAEHFSTTTQTVSSQLTGAVENVATVSSHQQSSLRALDRHSEAIDRIAQQIDQTSKQMAATAGDASTAFSSLRDQQVEFLVDLESRLTAAQDQLTANLAEIAEKMSEWLNNYSDQVRGQTNERLNEWNKQTQEYSAHMVDISQSLLAVTDELGQRSGSARTANSRR